MFWQVTLRVLGDYVLCLVARQLYEESIAGYVGNLEVESHTALLGAFEVAGTTQLEVSFGNAESVVSVAHDVDALACVVAEFIWCDKDAIALVGSTSHASAQLMEL